VVNGTTDTLQWLISDNLGSTSVTANADGSWNSEIRWKNGVTPTNYAEHTFGKNAREVIPHDIPDFERAAPA
jgi:hypothetical protein